VQGLARGKGGGEEKKPPSVCSVFLIVLKREKETKKGIKEPGPVLQASPMSVLTKREKGGQPRIILFWRKKKRLISVRWYKLGESRV